MLLRLGASRYAVAMGDVAEVAPVPGADPGPRAPLWLAGVANWRGRMLPVLDLRPLLARRGAAAARQCPAGRPGPRRGGRAAWSPRRSPACTTSLADPAPPPPTLTADAASLVLGQVADRPGPIAVLDAAAVLVLRERVDRRRRR